MGTTSFAYAYPWPTIEADVDAATGAKGGAATSVHLGDDVGTPIAATGGLVNVAPLSDEWQGVLDAVVVKLVQRDRDLEDYLGAWLQVATMVGVLDGSGDGLVAHGVNGAPTRVISCSAWYTASGSSVPLTVTAVDSTNVYVTGGVAAAAFRVTMIFGVGV